MHAAAAVVGWMGGLWMTPCCRVHRVRARPLAGARAAWLEEMGDEASEQMTPRRDGASEGRMAAWLFVGRVADLLSRGAVYYLLGRMCAELIRRARLVLALSSRQADGGVRMAVPKAG